MDKEKQKEMQQKYMELQMISQQIQQMQKQMEMVAGQLQELNITKQALQEISKTSVGKEIIAPLASGIFINAKLMDNKDVLVNVGAGATVKKTIPEAEELIKEQSNELTNFQREMELNLTRLASRAQQIEAELSELIK